MLAPAAHAHVSGLPIHVTGAPSPDAGQTCAQCHTSGPANSGGGRIFISAPDYTPGVAETITVNIQDPMMQRFGFQLTARLASDLTRQAGSFSPTNDTQVLCDPDGRPGPCGGALEYVAHVPASTAGSSTGTRLYVLTWTPPGRNLGGVVFYLAGIAGNGDNTAAGDHVYTQQFHGNFGGCNLKGPPVINSTHGVTDAAGYRSSISPNELISVFGFNFSAPGAPPYKAVGSDLDQGRLATDLSCLSLEIGGVRSPIFFTSNGQINAQAPLLDTTGQKLAEIVLNADTPNEIRSNQVGVQYAASAPGLFTFGGTGTGSIAGLNASKNNAYLVDPAVIPGGVFAQPGDIVTLYGTGFGLTNPAYLAGQFASGAAPITGSLVVRVGGILLAPQDILYAGLSPDAPGFFQFNLRVPQLPDGPAAVLMTVGPSVTQTMATIPIKN